MGDLEGGGVYRWVCVRVFWVPTKLRTHSPTHPNNSDQHTYKRSPDIPRIVRALVEGGVPAMQRACAMRVGTPIKPMLAKICRCVVG